MTVPAVPHQNAEDPEPLLLARMCDSIFKEFCMHVSVFRWVLIRRDSYFVVGMRSRTYFLLLVYPQSGWREEVLSTP